MNFRVGFMSGQERFHSMIERSSYPALHGIIVQRTATDGSEVGRNV